MDRNSREFQDLVSNLAKYGVGITRRGKSFEQFAQDHLRAGLLEVGPGIENVGGIRGIPQNMAQSRRGMAQSSTEFHTDAPLTNYASNLMAGGPFVADQVFPVVPVLKESDIIVEKDIPSSKKVVSHQIEQIKDVVQQLEQEFNILAMNSQILQQDMQGLSSEMKEK